MKQLHIVFALLLSVSSGLMCMKQELSSNDQLIQLSDYLIQRQRQEYEKNHYYLKKAAEASLGFLILNEECKKCPQKIFTFQKCPQQQCDIADECTYINQRLQKLYLVRGGDSGFISNEIEIGRSGIEMGHQRLSDAIRMILRDKSDQVQDMVDQSCKGFEDELAAECIRVAEE